MKLKFIFTGVLVGLFLFVFAMLKDKPGPTDLNLGSIVLHLYSLFFGFGILIAFLIGRSRVRNTNFSVQAFDSIYLASFLGAMIGARLFFAAGHWDYFSQNLVEVLYVWRGGFSFYGGLIGGLIVAFFWVRKHWPDKDFVWLLEAVVPGLALGQALGRWGNFFNQESFGLPTNLPWRMYIDPQNRPAAYAGENYFHPTFFYEALGLIAIFLVTFLLPWPKFRFLVLSSYLFLAGLLRAGVETIRVDALVLGGVKISLIASLVAALIGFVLLFSLAVEKFKQQRSL